MIQKSGQPLALPAAQEAKPPDSTELWFAARNQLSGPYVIAAKLLQLAVSGSAPGKAGEAVLRPEAAALVGVTARRVEEMYAIYGALQTLSTQAKAETEAAPAGDTPAPKPEFVCERDAITYLLEAYRTQEGPLADVMRTFRPSPGAPKPAPQMQSTPK